MPELAEHRYYPTVDTVAWSEVVISIGNKHDLLNISLHKPTLIVHKTRQLCINAGHKPPKDAAIGCVPV